MQSNKIYTGMALSMNRLESELKSVLQREREERRTELEKLCTGQQKLEARLGEDIRKSADEGAEL